VSHGFVNKPSTRTWETGMGYVVERVNKHGRIRYTAMYRDIRDLRRSAGTHATQDAAIRAGNRAEDDIAAGKIGDPRRGRQTLRHYVEEEWFPNHILEATTRENYRYTLDRYILPELGGIKMVEILPTRVREWIKDLQTIYGANPPTISKCKTIVDAIFTTAQNDQVTFLHAGKGVKTPPVATSPRRVISAAQYSRIYEALLDNTMRLLVETDIESGLRWGELTELRPKDIDLSSGLLTVSRCVVQLTAKNRPDGIRFVVKAYPKDKEWRQLRLAPHLLPKLREHIHAAGIGRDDLLFPMPEHEGPRRRTRPEALPDPATLGMTEPNGKGRSYPHGTTSAYGAGACRCQHCRDSVAAYRASRRAAGKDDPGTPKTVDTDGHIGRGWFRKTIWMKALAAADLGFHVTPHGLRHAHASWLLSGGADLQVVKERLGHARISTTERYLHALPGADQSALDALDAVRGRLSSPTPTGQAPSPDAELAELRMKVAKFKSFFESLDE
jgi:integrase